MRRFLCLLKNRLERLAIYSLLKKFVLIGFLTVPLSLLSFCNTSAYSVSTVNDLVSVSSQVFNPTDNQWATINNGTVTIPYTQNITHISQGGRQPVFFLRNVNGFIPLGGTLTGSYFSGYISIALTGYGRMIDYNSCEGIEADLYPANASIHEKNLRVSSCSVEYGNQTSVMYIQVDVAGSFYGVTSFTDFHFSINNSSNYLVKCNSNSDGPTTYCSSSDYWGISYIDQAWSASNDPNTGYLQDINVNINNINDSINQQIEQDQQDRDDISQSKEDADATAEDLSQDIDNASSSLLTIIGNFVSVIINPPERDCVINGDMGHMNLGQIDLCELSLPPSFQVISTLLMIGFIIPFAYSLIFAFLSLLKGATQD